MSKKAPPQPSYDDLYQLSKEELVEIIKALQAEIGRLKEILNLDSITSSKPPSQDIIKKLEKKEIYIRHRRDGAEKEARWATGHEGRTRKGFGRIDRVEFLWQQVCSHCGGTHGTSDIENVEIKQVAQLVAKPIEIVAYQNRNMHCPTCNCNKTSNNGHHGGKQRYRCKSCGCQFVESPSHRGYPDAVKELC